MRPKVTSSPRGRENTSVSANSSRVFPMPAASWASRFKKSISVLRVYVSKSAEKERGIDAPRSFCMLLNAAPLEAEPSGNPLIGFPEPFLIFFRWRISRSADRAKRALPS